MTTAKDLFLSHSHADKLFVRHLADDCQQRGVTVWVDEAELLVGDSLIQKIQSAIDRSHFFTVVVSANSVNSAWVQKELEQALESEISSKSVRVLPIVLGKPISTPGFLRAKLYADFSGWPDDKAQYESSLTLLVRSVSQRKLETAASQLRDVVPDEIPASGSVLSNDNKEIARSLAATITGLEENNAVTSDAETYYRLGNLRFTEDLFSEAVGFYGRAVRLAPNHLKAWFNKARALEKLGRFDEAQEAYRTGDKFCPDPRALSASLRNLACIFEALGRPGDALPVLERAIAVYPNEPYAYLSASQICESMGLYDRAMSYIEQFLAAFPYGPPSKAIVEEAWRRKAELTKRTGGSA